MIFTFTGKNLAVSQDMKDHAEKKIGRLSRLFPANTEVSVTFSVVKQENKVEVSVPFNKRILRAEVISTDMDSAIDKAVDILDKQRAKYKHRVRDKSRRDHSFVNEFAMISLVDEDDLSHEQDFEQGDIIEIERMKQFPLKPMDPEEAVIEMEMLGHNFFVFRHSGTFETNVVYKRRNGAYGLICPTDPADCE
ncbi:MAG: ribosome-associated translation inhibitor RaiA [Defluviitaleaceae bacterium]|nr:ribosome-associated translation inhibitor RaiA [Defluviitaleaceae bacterium]